MNEVAVTETNFRAYLELEGDPTEIRGKITDIALTFYRTASARVAVRYQLREAKDNHSARIKTVKGERTEYYRQNKKDLGLDVEGVKMKIAQEVSEDEEVIKFEDLIQKLENQDDDYGYRLESLRMFERSLLFLGGGTRTEERHSV